MYMAESMQPTRSIVHMLGTCKVARGLKFAAIPSFLFPSGVLNLAGALPTLGIMQPRTLGMHHVLELTVAAGS